MVHPAETLAKGGHCFSSIARLSMYLWSLASIQRPSRMYSLPRYTILHIFAITVSEQLNAQRADVRWLCRDTEYPLAGLPISLILAVTHFDFRRRKREAALLFPES